MASLSPKEENLKMLVDAHKRRKSQGDLRRPEETEEQTTRTRRFTLPGEHVEVKPVSPRSVDQWGAANWIESKIQVAAATMQGLPRGSPTNRSKVVELFQQERYDPITRGWRPCNLVLFADPYTTCNDVFDPYSEDSQSGGSRWGVDFTVPCIDVEGWSYGFDFLSLNRLGAGDSCARWNSFVRRRKWKYAETASTYLVYDTHEPDLCKVRTVRFSVPTIKPFANSNRHN